MKRIIKTLPSDWLYKVITMLLTTSSTYYLFKFVEKSDIIHDLWLVDEKYLFSTFLFLQFVINAFFYWILFQVIKKALFGKIKRHVLKSIHEPKSQADLKIISEIKNAIIHLFGMPIRLGIIGQVDLSEKIEFEKKGLDEIASSSVKWICVLIHTSLTSVIVYNINAFYILPLFLIISLVVVLYWYAITFVYGNGRLIEKTRKEILALNFTKKNTRTLLNDKSPVSE